jgi:hypothetical protein
MRIVSTWPLTQKKDAAALAAEFAAPTKQVRDKAGKVSSVD